MSIQEVMKTDLGQLLGENQFWSGKESANIFPSGRYTAGKIIKDKWYDLTLLQIEKCQSLDSIIIFHSTSGGTGSGFVANYWLSIKDYMKNVGLLSVMIMPSFDVSSLIVEPYNFVFGFHYFTDYCDLNFWYDNKSLYKICENKLKIDSPSFKDINKLISYHFSSVISSARFSSNEYWKSNESNIPIYESYSQTSFDRFNLNLVPHPKLHFISTSFCPYIADIDRYKEDYSTEEITNSVLNEDSYMIQLRSLNWLSLGSMLWYRGDVLYSDIVKILPSSRTKLNFIDYVPTGIAWSLTNDKWVSFEDDAPITRSVFFAK